MGLSDEVWKNLAPILNGLALVIIATGTLIGAIGAILGARRSARAEARLKLVDEKTDAQTAVIKNIDKKAEVAATAAVKANDKLYTAAGKLEEIGTHTNGMVGDLRKQLDTLYQQQIATFRETQQQLVDSWVAKQQQPQLPPPSAPANGDAAIVAHAITEALHATPGDKKKE